MSLRPFHTSQGALDADAREGLRAVSVKLPWAALLVLGLKRFESRTWPTRYRGWLAVHSSSSPASRNEAGRAWSSLIMAADDVPRGWKRSARRGSRCAHLELAPRGAFLGLVNVGACFPPDIIAGELDETERALGSYGSNVHGWRMDEAIALPEPVTGVTGRLGLWRPKPEHLEPLVDVLEAWAISSCYREDEDGGPRD